MERKTIKKIVSKITEGIFDKAIDLVLFGVYYLEEMSPSKGGNLYQKLNRIDRDFDKFNSQTLKRAIRKSQERGWLNNNLQITKNGQKRLESVLPRYEKKRKWNGKWYIVAYDIPEEKKYLREILRNNLKKLKFGQIQKSLWISPYNFLGDIEKIVNQYNISDFVLLSISDKMGRDSSTGLTRRVWKLDEINNDYEEYIREVKSKKLSKKQAIFKYLVILNQDPQLPEEILFDDWKGEEANRIYKKLS